MKRLLLIIFPLLLGLTACNKLTPEQAESAVLQGERDRLPLLLQTIPLVEDITIDSIKLNVTVEPMQGYIYTTWISSKKETPIIVPVDSIHLSKDRNGYVEWQSDWGSAAKAFVMKSIGF